MGYTITIGNAEPFKTEEGLLTYTIRGLRHDEAPAFGEHTDYTNARWPSYTQWANFLQEAGLTDLFTNMEIGLMRKHPGVFALEAIHLAEIRVSLERETSKGLPPGFAEGQSGVLARLVWLSYWVSWALDHCESPAICNS